MFSAVVLRPIDVLAANEAVDVDLLDILDDELEPLVVETAC